MESIYTGKIHGVQKQEEYMESYKDKYMEPIYIRNMESKYRRSK